ncbi:MAG: hypothetical protein LBP58_05280 [Azoarcus sp.]|jgi:hypothetical protein|nr:hypothetical protein [Azoarcus sp.]
MAHGLPRFARNDECLGDCGKGLGHCDSFHTHHREARNAVVCHMQHWRHRVAHNDSDLTGIYLAAHYINHFPGRIFF